MNRISARWPALLVVTLGLVLGACDGDGGGSPGPLGGGDTETTDAGGDGDDGASAPGATDIDGCEIVAEADAEAIIGPAQNDASAGEGLQTGGCVWTSTEEGNASILTFQVYEGAVFYGEEQFQDGEGFERVDGLGDAAFFINIGGPSLQVRDGETVIQLSAVLFELGGDVNANEDETKQQLRDLAEKVLDRL